jgi:hypothetical protein
LLLIPTLLDQQPEPRQFCFWPELALFPDAPSIGCKAATWRRIDDKDQFQPKNGSAFTLRLKFYCLVDRQTNRFADRLVDRFATWHEPETSLRETMAAIGSTLLEHFQHER